jgi:hypothetical protein
MHALDLPNLEAAAAAAGHSGVTLDDAFRDAWRQLHYAAQSASEVGKSWGTPRADDSHSSLVWQGTALLGERVRAPRAFRAALDVPSFALSLRDDTGTELAVHPLDGDTLAGAIAWSRAEAERLGGPARQPSVAAPDLPPHAIAGGARFARGDGARFAELAALLGGAAGVLGEVARQLAIAEPARVWPHHFDMAVLAAFGTDRTIGVGLAVPEQLEASGYWYVSPWAADAATRTAARWPALAHGRWVERGGPLRMAILPLAAWSALPTPSARAAALARFLVDGLAAVRAALA